MKLPDIIRTEMNGAIDNDYAVFQRRLTPTAYKIEGIRVPVLRGIAKNAGDEGRAAILAATEFCSFEEVLVYGFAAGYIEDTDELKEKIDFMLPLFDNWAHVDTITSSLKTIKKHRAEFLKKYEPLKNAEAVFARRFLAVMLLDHYMNDEYSGRVLDIYREITPGDYYVDTAVAWGLSVLIIKRRDETLASLVRGDFTPLTTGKAVQKAIESCRVSDEDKRFLRGFRSGIKALNGQKYPEIP